MIAGKHGVIEVLTQHQKENHSQSEKLKTEISSLQKQLDAMAHTLSEEKEKKQIQEERLAKDEIKRRIGREVLEKQIMEKENLIKEQQLVIDCINEDSKRDKQIFQEEKQKLEADFLKERAFSSELEYKNQQLEIQLKQNTEDSVKATEQLENDLKDKNREIFKLKRQIESLLDDQVCAQRIVKVTRDEADVARDKLTDKIKEIQDLENMYNAIKNEKTVFISEIELFKVEKQELVKEVDENNNNLKSMNQELQKLRDECNKSNEHSKKLLNELNKAQHQFKIIEEENQKKKEKLSSNKTRDENVVSNLFKLLELSKVKDSNRNCLISWLKRRRNRNKNHVNDDIMKPLSKAEEKYEIVQTLLTEFVEYW